jgi:hypothetical protein
VLDTILKLDLRFEPYVYLIENEISS